MTYPQAIEMRHLPFDRVSTAGAKYKIRIGEYRQKIAIIVTLISNQDQHIISVPDLLCY